MSFSCDHETTNRETIRGLAKIITNIIARNRIAVSNIKALQVEVQYLRNIVYNQQSVFTNSRRTINALCDAVSSLYDISPDSMPPLEDLVCDMPPLEDLVCDIPPLKDTSQYDSDSDSEYDHDKDYGWMPPSPKTPLPKNSLPKDLNSS
jgi:hypothetical protein